MKTLPLFCAAVLAAIMPLAFAADPLLAARDASWNELRKRADVAGLDKLIDPGFVLVHSDGRVQRKVDYLGDLSSKSRVNGRIENRDVVIREYGDTAVVNGVSVQSGVSNGQPWSGQFRFTRVWIRRGGEWTIVSSHSSRITEGQ
ncbi:nuclear transport factor 2 family protein [Massilia agilis]|uniref:Nuclear transport factor 2 family protein n=1 Tax=Massilia agilis TaxID=1811226 RepID=A0ABT2DG59_9BURK|nr:nuclear transport factor 2 family protein [Massilia agilis]MCS0810313.1 nuclear transport factor 2 family protein [Massilia agilis]